MTNPFSGIITEAFGQLHKDMISALLESGACTRPCKMVFTGSKMESCPNCIYDPIGRKSSNRYVDGGPIPFQGICPMCNGIGLIQNVSYETIDLMVIFDSREWIKTSTAQRIIPRAEQTAETWAQTICSSTQWSKLEQASEIILDTDLEGYNVNRYIREGEPEGCGLLNSDFIAVMWKRSG